PPANGMKKYVWSETVVEGGQPFTGKLIHPPSNTGAFQDMSVHDAIPGPGGKTPQFYADSAVVAYRIPDSGAAPGAKITSSDNMADPAMLSDGDLEKPTHVPVPAEGSVSWIQYEFPSSTTIRAITYVTHDPDFIRAYISGLSAPEMTLEASEDGQAWHPIVKLESSDAPEHTLAFAPVTARYFRVTFKRTPPPAIPDWAAGMNLHPSAPPANPHYDVAELILHSEPRVSHFVEKAAFVPVPDLYEFATPEVDASNA